MKRSGGAIATHRGMMAHRGMAMAHGLKVLKEIDTNQDKQLSKDEVVAKVTAVFDKIDANADGQITLEEGKKFHETQRAQWSKKTSGGDVKIQFSPENIFKNLDKNGDGKVTTDDNLPFWERLSGGDADKNGEVTKEELEAHFKNRRQGRPGGRGGFRIKIEGEKKTDEGTPKPEPAAETKAESAASEPAVPMPEEAVTAVFELQLSANLNAEGEVIGIEIDDAVEAIKPGAVNKAFPVKLNGVFELKAVEVEAVTEDASSESK
ncbi:MAG: EF-hand domain-containing protein [Planctomycetaceae bacterium]